MQAYDIIVLLLLIVATVWGARRGLAKQLATIASLVLGYIVAVNFREPVAAMIEVPHPWNLFAAMLGLFMATSLVIWIAFRFVDGTIEKAGLDGFDAQMGGLFGLLKGFVLAMALTMFAVVMLGDMPREQILGSFSGYNICRAISAARQIVPTEWQQTIQPYLETVEQHQQMVAQPPVEEFPDPFEVDSPSDSVSYEDDTLFGVLPQEQTQTEFAWPTQRNSQATLQEPQFDRRR